MKKARKFLLNTMILTGTSMLLRTIGMSFTVYISNKIGSEGVGVYQLLISVYSFGVTMATAGVGLTSTRMVADQLVRGSPAGARSAMRKCFAFSLLCSLAASALLFFGSGSITTAWFHGKISSLPLEVLSISLPFMAVAAVLSGYFTAVRRVVKSASAQVLEQFVHMGVAIALLTLVAPAGIEPACLCLVAGGALSEICSCLYLFILYRLDLRRLKAGGKPPSATIRRIFSIALPVGLSSLVRSGINTFKQVMVPLRLEKHGVSCDLAISQYGVIRGMVMPVLQFPSALLASFSSLLIPEITENDIQGRGEHINYMVGRIFKTTLLFSVCVGGILFTYADELSYAIYQDDQVSHFLRLLAPIVIIMYLDDIVDAVLKGLDRQGRLAGINILESVLSAFLLWFLLPHVGIYGYLIVLYFSELLNGSLSILCLVRTTHFRLRWFGWLALPVACIYFSCTVTQRLISGGLVCSIVFAVCLYLLMLYAVGQVTRRDFNI